MGFSGFTKQRKCFPFSFACNCAYKHTEQSTVQRYMGKIFVLILWWMSCILYDLHSLTTAQITNYYPTKLVLLSCETLFMCPHRHMHTYAFMHTWSFQQRELVRARCKRTYSSPQWKEVSVRWQILCSMKGLCQRSQRLSPDKR